MSFAAIYAGLGDHKRSARYLERAVEVRDTSLPVHLLSTEFDTLAQSSADSRTCAAASACLQAEVAHSGRLAGTGLHGLD